ncbi:hypothetical protein J6590_021169 [Homalodisca vitripennis]|nr:hypothetical protein J6590_021169 [Homalodisca vitripennis]
MRVADLLALRSPRGTYQHIIMSPARVTTPPYYCGLPHHGAALLCRWVPRAPKSTRLLEVNNAIARYRVRSTVSTRSVFITGSGIPAHGERRAANPATRPQAG